MNLLQIKKKLREVNQVETKLYLHYFLQFNKKL